MNLVEKYKPNICVICNKVFIPKEYPDEKACSKICYDKLLSQIIDDLKEN